MRPVARTNRLRGVAAVVCCAAVLPAVAPSPAASTARSSTPPCPAAATRAWLGLGLGGGTAGTYYYSLELSNVGSRACTLYGYPGVSAYAGAVKRVGPDAARNPISHATVTLSPGATAHATLGVHDWGALCTRPVSAAGLKVYPPGQRTAQLIPFAFKACAHRAVLVVGPVRTGVGIPGFTTP